MLFRETWDLESSVYLQLLCLFTYWLSSNYLPIHQWLLAISKICHISDAGSILNCVWPSQWLPWCICDEVCLISDAISILRHAEESQWLPWCICDGAIYPMISPCQDLWCSHLPNDFAMSGFVMEPFIQCLSQFMICDDHALNSLMTFSLCILFFSFSM